MHRLFRLHVLLLLQGIGLATAREFLHLGASVIVNGRDSEEVEQTVKELREQCAAGGEDAVSTVTPGHILVYLLSTSCHVLFDIGLGYCN